MELKSPRSSEAKRRLASAVTRELSSLVPFSNHGCPIFSTSFFFDLERELSILAFDLVDLELETVFDPDRR